MSPPGPLAELLASGGVTEICELRSTFGFMAVHGGWLESVTDHIATEAARRSNASVYAILQPPELRWHIPATAMAPADSTALRAFLDHVEVVVSVHGFGAGLLFRTGDQNPGSASGFPADVGYRPDMALLLGGSNRRLATSVAAELRGRLPDHDIVDELADIPARLRGLHPDNPVNLPPAGGVQLECGPDIRGLGQAWRHLDRHERRRRLEPLVSGLAATAERWPGARVDPALIPSVDERSARRGGP